MLSTFFWLLTTLAYVAYVRQPRRDRYRVVVVCFVLGLLTKPMLVTLPATLLLLDYWPLGRFRFAPPPALGTATPTAAWRLIAEKLPLFALAGGSCVMTVWAMHRGQVIKPLTQYTLVDRLGNTVIGYVIYLRKTVWPADLAPFYPLRPWHSAEVIVCLLVLVLICLAVVLLARRQPALLVGWLWYLGTLVPVIGLVQVGSQAYADRFSYVPLMGPFFAGVWLVCDVVRRRRWRIGVSFGVAGLVLACAAAAFVQTGCWRNSIALWTHTLAVTGDNFVAETNLGAAYRSAGALDLAVPHLDAAPSPSVPTIRSPTEQLAQALQKAGHTDAAIRAVEQAAGRWPDDASLARWLAELLHEAGRPQEATDWQRRADQIDARSTALPRRHDERAGHREEARPAVGERQAGSLVSFAPTKLAVTYRRSHSAAYRGSPSTS